MSSVKTESQTPEPPRKRAGRLREQAKRLWRNLQKLVQSTQGRRQIHPSVASRRPIEGLMLAETVIKWIWLSTLLIPVAYLFWYRFSPSSNLHRFAERLDNANLFPALAGVCSGVGALVAIFLPLTLHQFEVTSSARKESPEAQFRQQWFTHLQTVTKWNVTISILVLLADTVLVLLSISGLSSLPKATALNLDRLVAYTSLIALVFGLSCFILQLLTLGVTDSGDLDRVGSKPLIEEVPWFFYVRRILRVLISEIIAAVILGATIITILALHHGPTAKDIIFDFCLVIWLPLIFSTSVTLITSVRYRRTWRDRFLAKWGKHAGVGLVCTCTMSELKEREKTTEARSNIKILLNRQDINPFRGMWLLPGGYFNDQKGDAALHDTVRRRLEFLTEKQGNFVVMEEGRLASPRKVTPIPPRSSKESLSTKLSAARALQLIATRLYYRRLRQALKATERHQASNNKELQLNDFSPEYSQIVLRYSHAPTDTTIYCVTRSDGAPFEETDIAVGEGSDLKWWSLAEVESTKQIPAHFVDFIMSLASIRDRSTLWDWTPLGDSDANRSSAPPT